MPRRVSLPGASELFRPTRTDEPAQPVIREQPERKVPERREPAARPDRAAQADQAAHPRRAVADESGSSRSARGSGRVRHEEKITVYVSSVELVALEQARLNLRARHGMAVDRGRIVREAIAGALADLEQHGDESELIRRLGQ